MKFVKDPQINGWRELKFTDSQGDLLQVTVTKDSKDKSRLLIQVNPGNRHGDIVGLSTKQARALANKILKELDRK